MADNQETNVMMTFIQTSGSGVQAEASMAWDEKDPMMEGFKWGYVFAVDDWGFNASLSDSETKDGNGPPNANRGFGTNMMHNASGRGGHTGMVDTTPGRKMPLGSFAGFSGAFHGYIATGKIGQYKRELSHVTISKQMDCSSITFMDNCLKVVPYERAILVKRKFTGKQDWHEAFLRIEFAKPLVYAVEWDEGDITKEKLTFVCRGIKVSYKWQYDDGTLGDTFYMEYDAARSLAGTS